MKLIDLLTRRPCLLEEDHLREYARIVTRSDFQAETMKLVAFREGKRPDATQHTQVRDGVATISITGPIFRHATMMTDICGGATTQRIATDLQAAMDNPDVKAIILDIDSPGGEASGTPELAAAINAASKGKPVVAYVGGAGMSGGYYLASAASEVVVDQMSVLGSIGAMMGYTDTSVLDEKLGIQDIEVISSQSPNKRLKPTTGEGRAQWQRLVDDMGAVFVADVAKYRGVSQKTVLSDFGQGGLMVGKRAVKAGLADRLGSYEGLHSELSAGTWRRPSRSASPPTARADAGPPNPQSKGKSAMSFLDYMRGLYESDTAKPDADEDVAAEAKPAPKTAVLSGVATTLLRSPDHSAELAELKSQLAEQKSSADQHKAQVEMLIAEAAERETASKLAAETARVAEVERASKAFASGLIASEKAVAAESAHLAEVYAVAAEDDHAMPRKDGKSRVAILTESYEARPKHALGNNTMNGKPLNSRVLADETSLVPFAAEFAANDKYIDELNAQRASR